MSQKSKAIICKILKFLSKALKYGKFKKYFQSHEVRSDPFPISFLVPYQFIVCTYQFIT